jgi:hypothetical protein
LHAPEDSLLTSGFAITASRPEYNSTPPPTTRASLEVSARLLLRMVPARS